MTLCMSVLLHSLHKALHKTLRMYVLLHSLHKALHKALRMYVLLHSLHKALHKALHVPRSECACRECAVVCVKIDASPRAFRRPTPDQCMRCLVRRIPTRRRGSRTSWIERAPSAKRVVQPPRRTLLTRPWRGS